MERIVDENYEKKKQYLLEKICPITPNQYPVTAYAHLIEENIDPDFSVEETGKLHFELYTQKSIETYYEHFVENKTKPEDFIPFGCTLTLAYENSEGKKNKNDIENNGYNGWTKVIIGCNPGVEAHLSLSFPLIAKAEDKEMLPFKLKTKAQLSAFDGNDFYYLQKISKIIDSINNAVGSEIGAPIEERNRSQNSNLAKYWESLNNMDGNKNE